MIFTIIATTTRAEIPVWLKIETVEATKVNHYCEKERFLRLCQIGCTNFDRKWSCPPHSPCYDSFSKEYQYLCVIVLGIGLSNLKYISRDYLKIKAANSILKSRADKALKACIKSGEKYISTGSCRLCKVCKKKNGLSCIHPESMTYSYEAMGVNVSLMVKEIFGLDLLWYNKGNTPQYTCVVAGLLSNEANLQNRVKKSLYEFR